MYKSIDETMEKLKSPSWRTQQKNFFKDNVEFLQDQRIFNFFLKEPILGIGDIDYFKREFEIVLDNKNCNQCLVVINEKILDTELFKLLKKIKNIKRICISINKFLLYTNNYNKDIIEDYDQAILSFIKKIFIKRNITHYFVKNLKGFHFNFASPTTQFFIT